MTSRYANFQAQAPVALARAIPVFHPVCLAGAASWSTVGNDPMTTAHKPGPRSLVSPP